MTTKELYSKKKNCCGCEACVQVCPKKLIKMQPDGEGFFYPSVTNEEECLNCHLCQKVCPLKSPLTIPRKIVDSYGGYCQDESIIKGCASGGFAFSLSSTFIEEGGVVYGVHYEDEYKGIAYTRCVTIEQLLSTRGSKYAQSRKYDIYKEVKLDLQNGLRVLFLGLPCEIAALYHYVGKLTDNLFTVNLICHGPTSLGVHKSFIEQISFYNKNKTITDFSVRYKKDGWKPYYIYAQFSDGSVYLKQFVETDYGTAFQQLKRPSCGSCRFKVYDKEFGMPADLTIGDFHLAGPGMKQYNHWGSSQVSAHTNKGKELIELAKRSMILNPISERNAVHYNKAYFRPMYVRWNRSAFSKIYQKAGLSEACNHWSVKLIDKFVSEKRRIMSILAKLLKLIRR